MKRTGDAPGGGPPKRGRTPRTGQFAFKLLCPETLAASVVGSNGATVTRIQEDSGAHLTFSRRGDFYPTTQLRLLIISAEDLGGIITAIDRVLDQVIICGEEERQALESAGTLEDDAGEFVDASGEWRLRCALTESAARATIGEGGLALSELSDETGARIHVDAETFDGHQMATLGGSKEQVVAVCERLSSMVQADVEEPWFSSWADQRGFGKPSGGARGADSARGGRDEGPPRRGDAGGRHEGSGNTIFVGGLSQTATSSHLREHFERFGEINEADVKIDSRTGRSKGFGFVRFTDAQAVGRCLNQRESHVIDSKWVDVKRYESQSGGGGFGDGPSRRDDRRSEAPARSGPHDGDRGRPPRSGRNGHDDGMGRDGPGQRAPVSQSSRLGRPPPEGPDVGWFVDIAKTVPGEYLGFDYCITCSLPSEQCGALIGRRGENVTNVERKTGAKVQLSKKESGAEHRQLTIVGTIMSVYAAHLLLMRAFNEASVPEERDPPPSRGEADKIDALQRQIDMLKSQVGRRR